MCDTKNIKSNKLCEKSNFKKSNLNFEIDPKIFNFLQNLEFRKKLTPKKVQRFKFKFDANIDNKVSIFKK